MESLNHLGFSSFPAAATNGKWEMHRDHVASITVKWPFGSNEKEKIAREQLEEKLKESGLDYDFVLAPRGRYHHLHVVSLELYNTDPEEFEKNKPALAKAVQQYGDTLEKAVSDTLWTNKVLDIIKGSKKPSEEWIR